MKSIVVGNWKMNPATMREAKTLFEATRKAAERAKNVNLIVAPPAIFLRELKQRYKGSRISFSLQNAHFEMGGAYTGEISLAQGDDSGASHVIIGHAERRGMGETDNDIRKKVAAALALKMTPILCVGEKERTQNAEHFKLVREQLQAGFADVPVSQVGRVIVTYEPLWTIGKEKTMSPRDMHEMAIFIRKTVVDLRGEGGMKVKILYGGSVDGTNAGAMLTQGDVCGFLVGRASSNALQLSALLQAIENAS